MFYYHVDWQKHHPCRPMSRTFTATTGKSVPRRRARTRIRQHQGSGHYVGTVLNVIQSGVGWFGEGDDLFYVDGAKHPQLMGTGTRIISTSLGAAYVVQRLVWNTVAEGERIGARPNRIPLACSGSDSV